MASNKVEVGPGMKRKSNRAAGPMVNYPAPVIPSAPGGSLPGGPSLRAMNAHHKSMHPIHGMMTQGVMASTAQPPRTVGAVPPPMPAPMQTTTPRARALAKGLVPKKAKAK